MKRDQLLLVGALVLAGGLVASKAGVFKKMAATSGGGSILNDFRRLTTPFSSGDRTGYDPADPGRYVPVDDLVAGAVENDWGYVPTFNQQVDVLLGNSRKPGQDSVVRLPVPW